MSSPEAVLQFWFETPAADAATLGRKIKRWYMGGPELDAQIVERFGEAVEQALAGKLEHWAADVRGRLALIIVLDQFTRSMFRDDPRTYAGDALAQCLAEDAFDQGLEEELSSEERNFLIMPLLHAENLEHQERAVQEMERLRSGVPDEMRPVWAMGVEQAHKYRDIIRRFGRFPHRNAILGRESTAEEVELLRDWQDKGPPAGAKKLG